MHSFLSLFGIDKSIFKSAPDTEKAGLNALLDTKLPTAVRRAGIRKKLVAGVETYGGRSAACSI